MALHTAARCCAWRPVENSGVPAAAGKESFLDFIGVAVAGYRRGHPATLQSDYFLGIGAKEESTILGAKQKFSAIHAALLNAASVHGLDLDDGCAKATNDHKH